MSLHRCEHLKPEDPGTRYTAPYGIEAELCSECVAEFDHRFTEAAAAGRIEPLVEAAEQATKRMGGVLMETKGCTAPRKGALEYDPKLRKKVRLMKTCGLVCEPGKKLCPRHAMLAELAETTAADKAVAKQAEKRHAMGQRAQA